MSTDGRGDHRHDHHVYDHGPVAGKDAPVVDLDDASFEAGTEGAWTVVDFWTPWCGPCKAFHPVFDQVAYDTPEVRFARCDVDANPRSASALGILGVPTVVLFDPDGNEADRIVGVPPPQGAQPTAGQGHVTNGQRGLSANPSVEAAVSRLTG